jgi:hypothetical protein
VTRLAHDDSECVRQELAAKATLLPYLETLCHIEDAFMLRNAEGVISVRHTLYFEHD